jgi:hypothetical protein
MLALEQMFGVKLYDTNIPDGLIRDVNYTIKESGLDEPFDYLNSKYYVIAKNGDEIVGLVVYGVMQVGQATLPRFLHIIIAPKYKRSKLAYKMLLESEQELLKLGFRFITCFVRFDLASRDMKIKYALKWDYRKYKQNDEGEFFYKIIKERI